MGFERPGKLSLDQIRAGLDNGEIIRGDKGFEELAVDNLTLHLNRKTGELYFTLDGVTIYAHVMPDGTVQGIQLTESDTGNPYTDHTLARRRTEQLQQLHLDTHLE